MWNKLYILSIILLPHLGYAALVKLKTIGKLDGTHDFILFGYGIVSGLNKTGDLIDQATLKIYLDNIETVMLDNDNRYRLPLNSALVAITAKVNQGIKVGNTFDIHVSALNNSRSIVGGILLPSKLTYKSNDLIQAIAEGKILSIDESMTNIGFIRNGAIMQSNLKNKTSSEGSLKQIKFILNTPNIINAKVITDAINDNIEDVATYLDESTILIHNKNGKLVEDLLSLLTLIQELEVNIDIQPKIVVNYKTHTIVINEDIVLPVMNIMQNNTIIKIGKSSDIVYLSDLIKVARKSGLTVSDISNIIQAINRSGSLNAAIDIIHDEDIE